MGGDSWESGLKPLGDPSLLLFFLLQCSPLQVLGLLGTLGGPYYGRPLGDFLGPRSCPPLVSPSSRRRLLGILLKSWAVLGASRAAWRHARAALGLGTVCGSLALLIICPLHFPPIHLHILSSPQFLPHPSPAAVLASTARLPRAWLHRPPLPPSHTFHRPRLHRPRLLLTLSLYKHGGAILSGHGGSILSSGHGGPAFASPQHSRDVGQVLLQVRRLHG